jgi:hypothetical protein
MDEARAECQQVRQAYCGKLLRARHKLMDAGNSQPSAAKAYEGSKPCFPKRRAHQQAQGEVSQNRENHSFGSADAVGAILREQKRRNLEG